MVLPISSSISLPSQVSEASIYSYSLMKKSQVDSPRYDRFLSTLQRTFPSSGSAFSSSLAREIIERLRMFYLRSCSLELPKSLDECHYYFEAGLKALDAVGHLKLNNKAPRPTQIFTDGISHKKSQSQSKQTKRKNTNQNSLTDSAPFTAIRRTIPSTKDEAEALVAEILVEQWEILVV